MFIKLSQLHGRPAWINPAHIVAMSEYGEGEFNTPQRQKAHTVLYCSTHFRLEADGTGNRMYVWESAERILYLVEQAEYENSVIRIIADTPSETPPAVSEETPPAVSEETPSETETG